MRVAYNGVHSVHANNAPHEILEYFSKSLPDRNWLISKSSKVTSWFCTDTIYFSWQLWMHEIWASFGKVASWFNSFYQKLSSRKDSPSFKSDCWKLSWHVWAQIYNTCRVEARNKASGLGFWICLEYSLFTEGNLWKLFSHFHEKKIQLRYRQKWL